MADETWLTVRQVAQRLQLHEETVRRWLRDGKLKGRLLSDRGGYRIAASELTWFMEEAGEIPDGDLLLELTRGDSDSDSTT